MLTAADLRAAMSKAEADALTWQPVPPLIMHPRDVALINARRRPGESDSHLIARLIREGA